MATGLGSAGALFYVQGMYSKVMMSLQTLQIIIVFFFNLRSTYEMDQFWDLNCCGGVKGVGTTGGMGRSR